MKAQVIHRIASLEENPTPLAAVELPTPSPGSGQVLIRVSACGVCHTELDEIEGRTPPPRLPVVPGHQIVGRVVECGPGVRRLKPGERVGVAWLYGSCGICDHCRAGLENLCADFRATGRDADGGYAEFTAVPEASAFPLPAVFSDVQAAPLLCAGAIGYRSLALTGIGNGRLLGLTGFGASAHLVLKMVRHRFPDTRVAVFARSEKERDFAVELGAWWAGDTSASSPEPLDAIIDTTPAWQPVVAALANLRPGGRLVINAIRKEDRDKAALLDIDYPAHLWMEKEIKSVANVSRRDVAEFLSLAAQIPITPEVETYRLSEANAALLSLKQRHVRGAKVLVI
ncbi:MAG: zinc-dependent alcohol dehydrogenase family protein [Pseudomonadota bacterium]